MVIDGQADVERARREVRRLALALGFGRDPAEEVTIAASELATNLLKYAVGGRIGVAPISGPRGTGILIESKDDGPGIGDVSAALLDGQSTGGGLGGGLPGVRRLMDEVEIESNQSGTRITARKWLTLAS
ncbi:MAG: ATP-binding protein [Thermomicrobiales bacterium]